MPIIQNKKIYPWVYHGGPIDLNTLSRQKIRVTIRFPYRANGSKFDLDPLTVNLLSDIGISGNSRVYAVDWNDINDTRITMNNGMVVAKHNHTYNPGSGNDSHTKTYDITIYGDDLLKFRGFKKSVGQAPNGFDISCTLVDQNLVSLRRFIPVGIGDKLLKSGARINRAFWGKFQVYGKDIQGSVLQAVIRLNGNNEVRLVNPLVRDMNDWNNVRTDLEIDWGDGTKTQWFNRRINSGLFNTGSKYIPKHMYKGNIGDKFTITIKGVEPLLPIYCDVLELNGELPEDKYDSNTSGLLTYEGSNINSYRTELSKIKNTCYKLGSSLLANWINTEYMTNVFRDWVELLEVPVGFIGDNIRRSCKGYRSAFDGCIKLKKVDPDIIGETNNVVEEISMMFKNCKALTETIRLVTANKLRLAYAVYHMSGVRKSRNFLTNVPVLENIRQLFENSSLADYDTSILTNSPNIKDAYAYMHNTSITQIHVNMTQWHQIAELEYGYNGTKLANIKAGIFGGNFAKDSADKSVKMGHIFSNIGDSSHYVNIDRNLFQGFQDKSGKLSSNQPAWFKNTYINRLPEGLLYNIFSEAVGRFDLTEFFCGIKTNDTIIHNGTKYSIIPSLFKNSFGIKIINRMYADCNIGYLSLGSIPSDNITDVVQLFGSSSFGCRFPEKYFSRNVKITNWKQLFYNSVWKYPDIPIDDIIFTKSQTVQCDEMLCGKRSRILCYRLFDLSSTVKSVTASKIFDYTPSASHDFILGGRTHTCDNSTKIKPLIYTVVSKSNTKLRLFTNVNVSNGTAEYTLDPLGNYTQVTLPSEINITKGTNNIYIKSQVPVYIENTTEYEVAYIGGEFPYNSQVKLPTNIFPREIDRFVFSICDHNFLHKEAIHLKYIPILHRDIFKYHHDVTSTRLLRQVADISYGIYGLQPRIYKYMTSLTNLNTFCDNYNRVISSLHIPTLKQDLNNAYLISFRDSGNDNDKWILTNVHIQDNALNHSAASYKLGKAQSKTSTSDYLEFRLSSSTGTLSFNLLSGKLITPITVETLVKGDTRASKHVLNSISDTISIPANKEAFVRIYSTSGVVWLNNNRQNISEIYGSIPKCNFVWMMSDLAPNLRRVGELLFIYCTNTSFDRTFNRLPNFEYFPGTLFWYNYKATSYVECFANCPKLFKVDDYIITDKEGDVDCSGMFKNSGVTNVRRPISDDVNGKVVIADMFLGCKTDYWYNNSDIDSVMFKNIDVYGSSKIAFSGKNSQQTTNNFCNIDPDNENLSNISYYNISTIPFKYFKYASQSIAGQSLLVNWSNVDNRYLPFLVNMSTTGDINGSVPENIFTYNERLRSSVKLKGTVSKITSSLYYRCNDMTSIGGMCQGSNMSGTDIEFILPQNMQAVSNAVEAFGNARGVVIQPGYKLSKHVITRANNMFKLSNIHVPYGFFDNVNKEILYKSSSTDAYWTPYISGIFVMASGIVEETGIFRSYGEYLNPIHTTNIYSSSSLSTLQPDKVYEGCEHLEVLDYHFDRCTKLGILPKINHLIKAYSYQHMLERCNILDIPANYLYTTRSDKTIMLDYMFANNPELFFTEVWIDGRCPGYFSIDYSLNEVFSGIGDDPEIFGHVKYDAEYEHRSRVYPFDTRVTWTQIVETYQPNVSVRLEGLYTKNLVGFDPEKVYAVMWGDNSKAVVVRDGFLLEEQHITHTYANAGRYEVRVMLRNECCYLPTPESNESKIKTIDLPTSFKYGNVTDIRDKGLYNMFGTGVKHISKDLFTKLGGIENIQIFNNMFYKFKSLADLENGILDCMPNLATMKNFLSESKSNISFTLKVGLLDKLTKLSNIEGFGYMSNIKTVEPNIFDKNVAMESMLSAFAYSKVSELPRDLLYKLTRLNNVNRLVMDCSDFILDESYSNFFSKNPNIEWCSGTFIGVKINAIPTNIMKPMINLVNTQSLFASSEDIFEEPWNDGDKRIKVDANDLTIPSGFLSANTKLQFASNMFAGRKSVKSYPANLLSTNKALVETKKMFTQTGISNIHQGTFDGFSTNIDARYMFYGCRVRLCPKPIINCTGTFKTLGMLFRVSGLMTEEELFGGIKTDPADIQSMYRQELEYYIMDGTFSGNMYLKAIEPATFPWEGYTIDIDPGDGNVITIETDVANQDKLTELTRFTPKGNTIKVKAPFAIELAGGTAKYTRLSGVFGRMNTTTHIPFKNTGYKSSYFTVDDDNFYKRNTHLTSLNLAFSATNIEYFKTNGFKYLAKVNTIVQAFYNAASFKIKDGYKPNFDHMKLTDITESFGSTQSLVINKDWEPFANIATIEKANSVFNSSGIIVTPRINTTSLKSVAHAYWMCYNLTTTYGNILDGASKCNDYTGAFGHCPKLSIVEGATDSSSIGSTAITGVTGKVDYVNMFINTALSQQNIARIVNNLGAWKVNTQMSVNTASMFENRNSVNRNEAKTPIRINTSNKNIHAVNMFYNAKIMNVPNQAIVLTGNSVLNYTSMFYNCFADPSVEILNDVFNIPGQTAETDFRNSELDTLNVFRISVTPEQTANVMSETEISARSIIDNIEEIPNSNMSTNLGDISISDNIEDKHINSTNISSEVIVDSF